LQGFLLKKGKNTCNIYTLPDDTNIANAKRLKSFQEETRSVVIMSSNKPVVPEAKEALAKFKMEAANEVGVNLKQGYNGDLTSKQAGSIGGQMVKKMIQAYENSMK